MIELFIDCLNHCSVQNKFSPFTSGRSNPASPSLNSFKFHHSAVSDRITFFPLLSITPLGLLALPLAFLVPPLGVLLETGIERDFIINILLTFLGYIPGIIHAVHRLYVARRQREAGLEKNTHVHSLKPFESFDIVKI